MTVSELRKALKGIKGDTPVYMADHDHGTYETNSLVNRVMLIDQKNADDWEIKRLDKEFHIE